MKKQTHDPERRQVLLGGAAIAASSLVSPVLRAEAQSGRMDSLWYTRPADEWVQALALGNGRIGAMMFGGIANERLQLNEDTFFSGGPYDPVNPEARAALPKVRELVFAGKYVEAQALVDASVMARPLRQMSYQTVGDLLLTFPGIENATNYLRELHLPTATAHTQFDVGATRVIRTAFASAADQAIVLRLATEQRRKTRECEHRDRDSAACGGLGRERQYAGHARDGSGRKRRRGRHPLRGARPDPGAGRLGERFRRRHLRAQRGRGDRPDRHGH